MPLDSYIAGHYSGAYNSLPLGITEDGYEIMTGLKTEELTKSDAYGDTLLDFLYRGGRGSIAFDCLAVKAGSMLAFSPWAAWGQLGPVGKWGTDASSPLVLTAAAGTSASTTPATLTASKAISPSDAVQKMIFTSRHRKVPVKLACLPFVNGSLINWFTQS